MNTTWVIKAEIISGSVHVCYSVYVFYETQSELIHTSPDTLQVFYWAAGQTRLLWSSFSSSGVSACSSLSFSSRTESTDFSSSTRSDTQLLTCFLNVHLLLFLLHSFITKFDFINIYDLPLNLLYSALSSWHDLTGVDARWCHCFHISLSVWKTISMHVFNTEFILFCQFNTSSVKVTEVKLNFKIQTSSILFCA